MRGRIYRLALVLAPVLFLWAIPGPLGRLVVESTGHEVLNHRTVWLFGLLWGLSLVFLATVAVLTVASLVKFIWKGYE